MFGQVKTRMTIYFSVVVFVLMAGFSGFLYIGVEWLLYRHLERELLVLADAIEDSYDPQKNEFTFLKPGTENLQTAREGWVRIIAGKGEMVFQSDHFVRHPTPFPLELAATIPPDGQLFRNFSLSGGEQLYSIVLPVRNSGAGYTGGWVEVGQPLKPVLNTLSQFQRLLLLSFPLVLVAIAALSYYVVSRFIGPVALMAEQTEQITHHNLSARLPVVNPRDEFGRLAQRFNNLLDRLESSFMQQRELLSDISHELKTPITLLRLRWENQIATRGRPSHSRLAADIEELTRLSQMVSDLGLLAQTLENTPRKSLQPLDLNNLLRAICKDLQLLAEQKQQQFLYQLQGEARITGDAQLLRRLFINLLDNAIKYTPEGGCIRLSSCAEDGVVRVHIKDTGIGMSPAEIDRVFERFYRGENIRKAGAKGSGLGLTLAQWIARIHHGRLQLTSEPGKGSWVQVEIPRLTP